MNERDKELALEAGFNPFDTECYEGLDVLIDLIRADERSNIRPQSSMAYQEGMEAGRLVEREACAKVCDRMAQRTQDIRSAALESAAENIRARGNI